MGEMLLWKSNHVHVPEPQTSSIWTYGKHFMLSHMTSLTQIKKHGFARRWVGNCLDDHTQRD